jgi:hypothetical protein
MGMGCKYRCEQTSEEIETKVRRATLSFLFKIGGEIERDVKRGTG